MGEPAAPWALSLCPSAPLVCQAENGAVYRGGNSPPTRAKAGRWGGRSGRVCGLTVVQLHHKRVVYVSQDVSLHFGPNAVTHWSKEEGAYQRSGRPAQQRLQPWLRRTLFSTCSSCLSAVPKTGLGALPISLALSLAVSRGAIQSSQPKQPVPCVPPDSAPVAPPGMPSSAPSLSGIKISNSQTSLVVWWLRLCTSTRVGVGSIPGWGSSTCHAVWPKKARKKSLIIAEGRLPGHEFQTHRSEQAPHPFFFLRIKVPRPF